MKKLYTVLIIFISTLLVGNLATAQMLNLWIDDDRVVYDTQQDKYFYPHLSTFFNMVYDEQEDAISDLDYAKIDNWRWAYYDDMIPMRVSLFGVLNLNDFNRAFGKNTNRFFMWTDAMAIGPMNGYVTHGRTGDEEGDPDKGGTGAIISAQMNPTPISTAGLSPRYVDFGVQVNMVDPPHNEVDPDRPDNQFYTLPRGNYGPPYESKGSEAQDHWYEFDRAGSYMYNDDLNYTPEDLPYAVQDNNPDAQHPLGAWTVYDGDAVAEEVTMDIKPGSWPNSINLKSKGVLPVAILTTDDFDATTIDPHSIMVGSDPGFPIAHKDGHVEDVDKDGDLDLVLHFNIQELGLWPGDELWGFYAETFEAFGGEGYIFTDEIRIVSTGKKKSAAVDHHALNYNVDVYPNPFSYETNIRFHLPEAGHVILKVYNSLGQEIQMLANTYYEAGTHTICWDGTDMSGNKEPSGIYIYRIQLGDKVLTDRIQMIR